MLLKQSKVEVVGERAKNPSPRKIYRGIPVGRFVYLFPSGHSSAFSFLLDKENICIMDAQNRRTASGYINNLLLSRGLLRNGAPIDFATPGNAEGGLDATMGQVMNLIHDLILRRDVCRSFLKPGC